MNTLESTKTLVDYCGQYGLRKRLDQRSRDGGRWEFAVSTFVGDSKDVYVRSDWKPTEVEAEQDAAEKLSVVGKPVSLAEKAAEVEVLRKKLAEYENNVKKK